MSKPWRSQKHKITVHYKSGRTIKFTCEDLNLKWDNDQLTSMTWKNATPKPLYVNLSAVESVWTRR